MSTWTKQNSASHAGNTIAGVISLAFPATPVAGRLLIVCAYTAATPANAMTLTGSGTWTQVGSNLGINSTSDTIAMWYKISDGTETAVSVNQTGGGTAMIIFYEEWSGNATASVLETSNTHSDGTTAGTTVVTGTITTAVKNDLIVVFGGLSGTSGGFGSPPWVTATEELAGTTAKASMGTYKPNALLTAFQDTLSWLTSTNKKSAIIAAFKNLPISQAIGLASETDSLFALTPSKSKTLGRPTETDTVFPLTVVKSRVLSTLVETDTLNHLATPTGHFLGIVTETETLFPLIAQKSRVLGRPSETDSLFAITGKKSWELVQLLEDDSLFHVTAATGRTILTQTETDTLFPLTPMKTWYNEYNLSNPGANQVPLGLYIWAWKVNDWDTGEFRFSLKQSGSLLCSSVWTTFSSTPTEYYLPITGWVSGGGLSIYIEFRTTDELSAEFTDVRLHNGTKLGLVSESDTLFGLSRTKKRTLGLLTETDTLSTLVLVRGQFLSRITEVETVFPLGKAKARTVGLLIETETVFPLTAQKGRVLTLLIEADSAIALAEKKSRVLASLDEEDSIFSLTRDETTDWSIGSIPI